MLFYELFRLDSEFLSVKSGDCLFRAGEAGEVMYVLISGEAEVTISGVLFEKCTQGALLGEISVIEGSRRYATVTARTDCNFAVIDAKRFQYLVDETPGFAINVMRLMAKRLKECDLRVVQACSDKCAQP
ncbi:MAG: cyclic nucleotide-binding domain-containing protein [Gallionella sp.]|nr:cyclic nucleotide-binding domain-containing protein [Gallionella sp.]